MQLSFGIMETKTKDETLKVRCVRGDTEPAESYTDNGNGTVTDNVTGLMWEQKTASGNRAKDTTHTWLAALNYCEDLVLGDFSDWRLPNTKELERMVDISTSNPAVDTTSFPNTNTGYYWTSSTCVGFRYPPPKTGTHANSLSFFTQVAALIPGPPRIPR